VPGHLIIFTYDTIICHGGNQGDPHVLSLHFEIK
jgi:hypothetical protein